MTVLYQCPLCSSTQLESYGFKGLNIILKCLSCGQTFRDSTSLESDLLQSENKHRQKKKSERTPLFSVNKIIERRR